MDRSAQDKELAELRKRVAELTPIVEALARDGSGVEIRCDGGYREDAQLFCDCGAALDDYGEIDPIYGLAHNDACTISQARRAVKSVEESDVGLA